MTLPLLNISMISGTRIRAWWLRHPIYPNMHQNTNIYIFIDIISHLYIYIDKAMGSVLNAEHGISDPEIYQENYHAL